MSESKKYRVLLAEDDFLDREIISELINNHKNLLLIDTVSNGKDALDRLQNGSYDLFIMDVDMPHLSGIEVLDQLEHNRKPYIIFATAHTDFAVKAYDFEAVDYLVKPISKIRFNRSIERFIKTIIRDIYLERTPKNNYLHFKENNKQMIVSYNDIIYFSSRGKHSIIHCKEKDHETAMLLKEIKDMLPPDVFMRIHKQHIINTSYFEGLRYEHSGIYTLFLSDEDETSLPVGRSYVNAVKKLLINKTI